jgi:hypothetical protein
LPQLSGSSDSDLHSRRPSPAPVTRPPGHQAEQPSALLRHSGRNRRPAPTQEDDVYGDKTLSERPQVGAREWCRIVGESSHRQPSCLQQQSALGAPVNSPTAPPSAGNEPSDSNTADTPLLQDDLKQT